MKFNLKKFKIESLLIVLIVVLAVLFFYYPVIRQIPVGTDAATYINDAKWIVNNGEVPKPNQPTYHGYVGYVAPIIGINVALLHEYTDLDILFPIFSIYQLMLIVLLVFTGFLVGKIYSRFMSIMMPIALLGSFSIIRLFMGSSVANLLAFVYVNGIYYTIHQYIKNKSNKLISLVILLLVSIYFSHKYLTAPIFIPFFIVYLLTLMMMDNVIREKTKNWFVSFNKYVRAFFLVILASILVYLFIFYEKIFLEAKNAFWKTNVVDKFRNNILISQYGDYLGEFVFTIAIFGIILYIFNRKNLISYKLLPFFWIFVLFIILQSYLLGVNFYFERIVFLAGVFIPLFAAYFLNFVVNKSLLSIKYKTLIISLFIIFIIVTGINRVVVLYDNSNNVSDNQVEVLNTLRTISTENELIFSHRNGVSETNHDIMVSDRDIIRLSTNINKCGSEISCLSFNDPLNKFSIQYFKDNYVKYFLLMKPNKEGNDKIDELGAKYNSSNEFNTIYYYDDAQLFELK